MLDIQQGGLTNVQNTIIYDKKRFKVTKEWKNKAEVDDVLQCVQFEDLSKPLQKQKSSVFVFNLRLPKHTGGQYSLGKGHMAHMHTTHTLDDKKGRDLACAFFVRVV